MQPVTPVHVSPGERERLEAYVRRTSTPQALAKRVRMILLRADGVGPASVARRLGCAVSTVDKWSARWRQRPCFESLLDAPRSGRPPSIGLETRCEIVKIACNRPAGCKAPLREVWTLDAIATELHARTGILVSRSSVHRVLQARGLRPHRVRPWLHSPDPDFRPKVRRICELYLDPPKDAVVLCIDEKPMQVLCRKYPTRRARDASLRREFEYVRHGTRALLGAFEVRRGKVVGEVVKHRDAATMLKFMERLARRYPRQRIIVIWDNLNIHKDGLDDRWSLFNARHGNRFEFVYTPLHASWLNQIEIWFSILQRRVLRLGSFDDAGELEAAVRGFIAYWNRYEAHPFRWKFSGDFVQAPHRTHGQVVRHPTRRFHGRALVEEAPRPRARPRPQARQSAHSGVGIEGRTHTARAPAPYRDRHLGTRNAIPLPLGAHALSAP
jgi:transposase